MQSEPGRVDETRLDPAAGQGPSTTAADAAPAVLVADDHDDTRELLATILRLAGFRVITACNGLEAVIAAHTCRPALIIMDVQMPVLDGLEAARLLKAADVTRRIPVIAHTAGQDTRRAHEWSFFTHVLPKPTHPDVLLALAARYLPAVSARAAGQ